ncbi:UDP-glucuronosyl/UDP-glucosyltransferase [Macrophomina phaseolina MS6]|uniref:UDP-glucuronosyl/UDP-glucosyltransferase n=1 Tax=Macrophomina phaseolina (strain MS6) TaxID=1126212 RepID=K2ST33_MACPH|nr:UDP-glucuronosyl/UDP-glucosyltransferase [Macrophomina phaseolina MS6]
MAYMVKNPGLIPSMKSLQRGDIQKKRAMVKDMLQGCWKSYVCGFFFRDPPDYKPSDDLDKFLRSGPPPVYIGFGSIVLENAQHMSEVILEAVRTTGVRAIISRGWSKLDGPPDENIFFLGDCPHEWLFQHVAAVVHHGGAGTTACGLLNARPTTIVPFFGE